MSMDELSTYTFLTKYARYNKALHRRETFEEATKRVFDMHRDYYKGAGIDAEIAEAEQAVLARLVLGSQRALQFGGKPIIDKNARIYNCLEKDTQFITSNGVKTFNDFKDGDTLMVPTHTGKLQKATVRSYGRQKLNKIYITRGNKQNKNYVVRATANHRWFLADGTVTENLAVGDKLMFAPTSKDFDYLEASPLERLYWCYGYVYGDGTRLTNSAGEYTYSMVRLCGKDAEYKSRFEEMGFSTSTSLSLDGDFIAYTGKYLKTAPDLDKDSPELIKAFIAGYLSADGNKSRSCTVREYEGIQSSDAEHIEFLRKALPAAGYYIVSETELTGQETNYGIRPYTVLFRITSGFGKTAANFYVTSVVSDVEEEVWCLEVEEDQSFILPFGVVTGNCCATFIDRPEVFQETMWLLLCGCGAGFSVQRHHVAKLPRIAKRDLGEKIYVIPDSIEGWADALGVLLSSYFEYNQPFPDYAGYKVKFDFSQIRKEGSKIGGTSGRAPGPKPLKRSLELIELLLDKRIAEGGSPIDLDPIDAYDIIMHSSDAVLAGGVRRSATICLFSPDDNDMATAKTGDWFTKNPQRARSNNSALLIRDITDEKTFGKLMESVKEFGEPGFVWADTTEFVVNPCQPSEATVLTPKGLRTFGDIEEGSTIWSKEGWTTVTKKWSTGVKPVFKYQTASGFFLGTDNHRVVSNGEKIEVGKASSIDILAGYTLVRTSPVNEQLVLDGFLIGDGSRASNCATVLANIGEKDSEVFSLPGVSCLGYGGSKTQFKVIGSGVVREDLVPLPERGIPSRYLSLPSELLADVLRGLYSANGSVVDRRITFKTSSPKMRDDVQLALSSIGIRSYYTTNKAHDVVFANGTYTCKESYDINISTDVDKFASLVGFMQKYKQEKLTKLLELKRNPACKTKDIISIEPMGEMEVFDITVANESHTYWTGACDVSNCCEIGFYPVDERTGKTGWHFCNLTEINMKLCQDEATFYKACRASSILGTLQAGYNKFSYLTSATDYIVRRDALLGCSMTGMADSPDVAFNPEIQRKGAQLILDVNGLLAPKIGVSPCARATCVKPAGSTSCIFGSASGIHPHHSERYFRRVQTNKGEAPAGYFQLHNPKAVEKSVWNPNGTDVVITFCVEAPDDADTKQLVHAVELLEKVKLTQMNWVETGNRHSEKPGVNIGISHNVSNTINVRQNEWSKVAKFIYANKQHFTGVSLLPDGGDLDYPQAPFTDVWTFDEIVDHYGTGSLFASGLIVDGLHAFGDLWTACDYVVGRNILEEPSLEKAGNDLDKYRELVAKFVIKKDWLRRAEKFAQNYFNSNMRKMTHCLKRVNNCKLWEDITREHQPVDWTLLSEDEDNTKPTETVACGGGACAV